MPYNIIKSSNSNYELRLKKGNKLLGTHTSIKKAEAQRKAIEAQKHNPSKEIDGYRYFISDKPNKKLKVKVNDKWIYFGQYPHQHYNDRTNLLDNKYNHLNDKRRELYLKRALNIRDKQGNLTANNPESANYHAIRILW